MSMTKYECAVEWFQHQGGLGPSYKDIPVLEALNAGGQAIELLSELVYGKSVNETYLYERVYKLLKEWN